ncbi:MAG: SIMPL domain-containing protein [Acidobacteria bacterium]|nr:SIMPL domain-containing protein [Acidobacteriota bacterium]
MRFVILGLAFSAALFAQQPNTVQASVSISQSITTGNAVFNIQFLDAGSATTVDSAVGALSSAGVAASQLSNVSVSISQGFVVTTYTFTTPVPAGQFTAMRDKLIAIQRTLSNSNSQALGWSTVFVPTDDEVSSALQAAMPALLNLAKQRAGTLAQAMNATLGAVVSLSAPTIVPSGPALSVSLSATYSVTPAQ